MLGKRLFHKHKSKVMSTGSKAVTDLDLQVVLHYGIPYTSSILAFDPIQRLLAIGTLDGRIKIIGGDNIEGLLISPKKLPYKNLEFIHNRGLLVGVCNDNDIQVWDLECRCLAYSLQSETSITAFAVIHGTYLMYIGDENGVMSVLRYDSEEGKLLMLPYSITAKAIIESAGISCPNYQSIVGILPQPSSSGTRVLIAYENGLIILWDVSGSHVVTVRGYRELWLKGEGSVDHQTEEGNELEGNAIDQEHEENEICSLCWASNSGSILAVGYINGDILLFDMFSDFSKKQQASSSSKAVVKLQLASGERRLPVIVLNWSANAKASDKGGQLLIYGGDDIGSEEVLTVLNLEWSSGIDSLRCISRVDLKLSGSFADMILIPNAGTTEHNSAAALFVLTNPGQLNVYDGAMLPVLKTEEGKLHLQAEKFPVVVPTIDPCITVTKICLLPLGRDSSKDLLKKAGYTGNLTTPTLFAGTKWPLTGGVPSEAFVSKDGVERMFISGYQDGSVRIWDATSPILKLMFFLEEKIPGIEVDDQSGSISALDFCPMNMCLAVGNECGLVCIYKLHGSTDGSSLHLVTEAKHEVHIVQHGQGYHCIAVFVFSKSSIRTLKFAHGGEKLAVGFETGQVAMLDMSSVSIMFRTDCLSGALIPIMSIAFHENYQISAVVTSPKIENAAKSEDHGEVILVLTKDANVFIIDSVTGKMISSHGVHPKKESAAISMYVIDEGNSVVEMASETFSQHPSGEKSTQNDSKKGDDLNGSKLQQTDWHGSSDVLHSSELLSDPLLLLCCNDSLWLCPLKSVNQNNSFRKATLVKRCCWSATFKKREEKGRGLILLYETGDLEMRSLPDLEVLGESSIMSILRWNFKTNMEKSMSSYDNGQITMVNGCELAFISLVACENEYRLPESLPCLHDKVVAAAADAAIGLCLNQKKRQAMVPGILGGIFKGLKGGRAENDADVLSSIDNSSFEKLENFFSKDPFNGPSAATSGDKKAELSIDDVEIDDVLPVSSSSRVVNKHKKMDEKTERDKLFHGASDDAKPRKRTTQEIMTQYRFGGDAAAAAAHAKDKLNERQEKLEMLSKRTAELQDGAQNFAEMAHELARTMEKKKWWKI